MKLAWRLRQLERNRLHCGESVQLFSYMLGEPELCPGPEMLDRYNAAHR